MSCRAAFAIFIRPICETVARIHNTESYRGHFRIVNRFLFAVAAVCAAAVLTASAVNAATIVDEWPMVQAPAAPTLTAVRVDPKSTALLVLDLVKVTCNDHVGRCLASIPKVAKLLTGARESKTTVVYSLIFGPNTTADVLPEVAPLGSEPVVKGGPDKFIGTDLEKVLRDKGITTVIVVGTAANGAVLYTASHAALLGFNVIVPVDGMSAPTPYAEQFVAWNMLHAPIVSEKVKLSAIDMVTF
jgi:nicotinamidase-related amidase